MSVRTIKIDMSIPVYSLVNSKKGKIILPDGGVISGSEFCMTRTNTMHSEEVEKFNEFELELPQHIQVCDMLDDKFYTDMVVSKFVSNDMHQLMKFCKIFTVSHQHLNLLKIIEREISDKFPTSDRWELLTSAPDYFAYIATFRSFEYLSDVKKRRVAFAQAKADMFNKANPDDATSDEATSVETTTSDVIAVETNPNDTITTPVEATPDVATDPVKKLGDYSNFATRANDAAKKTDANIIVTEEGDIIHADVKIQNFKKPDQCTNRPTFVMSILNPSDYRLDLKAHVECMLATSLEISRDAYIKAVSQIAISDHFHLLFSEKTLRIANKTMGSIFSYYLFYMFYRLRIEEYATGHTISKDSRVMHDIDTWTGVRCQTTLFTVTNSNHVLPIQRCLNSPRRIRTFKEFQAKFDTITYQVFRDFPLDKFNATICGSLLLPCAYMSYLESAYENFEQYVENLYPSFRSKLKDPATRDQFKYTDVDVAIHCSDENYDELAHAFFEEFKTRDSAATMEMEVKDFKRPNGKFAYKYRIFSPVMMREIDLFPTDKEPQQLIQSFHLPCIRMYYDGTSLKLTSQCVMTLLTGVNHIYSYKMSQNADVIGIIMKYIDRGISTLLTRSEYKAVLNFCINQKLFDSNMYKIKNGAFIRRYLTPIVETTKTINMSEAHLSDIEVAVGKRTFRIGNNKTLYPPKI